MAKKKKQKEQSLSTSTSITILIHGTFSSGGFWHRPGSRLHRHIARYFPDVYSGDDFYRWSGDASDEARLTAASELIDWCSNHPADQYNLICHSHGCNVANLASNMELTQIAQLVYLSPPIWAAKQGYLPNIQNVASGKIYNFHAKRDFIVTEIADAAQNLQSTALADCEEEYILHGGNHWAPVLRRNWIRYNIGEILTHTQIREV